MKVDISLKKRNKLSMLNAKCFRQWRCCNLFSVGIGMFWMLIIATTKILQCLHLHILLETLKKAFYCDLFIYEIVRVFSLSLKEATLVKKGKVWKGHRSITFKESMALNYCWILDCPFSWLPNTSCHRQQMSLELKKMWILLKWDLLIILNRHSSKTNLKNKISYLFCINEL